MANKEREKFVLDKTRFFTKLKQCCLTEEILGNIIGKSSRTIQRAVTTGLASKDLLDDFARIFNVTPAWLMGIDGEELLKDVLTLKENICAHCPYDRSTSMDKCDILECDNRNAVEHLEMYLRKENG